MTEDSENQEGILREILIWTKANAYQNVELLLRRALPDEKSRIAYQLTDGSRKVKEIQSAASIGSATIARLFDRCVAMGLMEEVEPGKRHRLFDLDHFDMMPRSLEAGDDE